MNMTVKQLQRLEYEIVNLRLSLEQFSTSPPKTLSTPRENRHDLLKLFGAWDGEIDTILHEFYERREKRGRLE